MEDGAARHELLCFDVQLVHGVAVQYVDAAPTVNQYMGETGGSPFCHEGGVQHQCIRAGRRHHLWVIGPAPADRLLRPMHKLCVFRGDRVDFLVLSAPTAPVFSLACKDDIGGVFVWELVLKAPSAGRAAGGGLEVAGQQVEAAPALRLWRFA